MILDIEQREKDIIISYYNDKGEVAFKQYPIDKFQNWYVCDDKDRAASTQYKNWDGRSVKLGYGRQFNKFSILYFLDSLSEKDKKELTAYNMPKTYFVDIETEIVDGFPKAEEAKSRILSFSIITPDRKAIVLGLEDMDSESIKKIQDDTNEYFKDFDQDWEFKYHKFKSEYDMVYTFLMKFLPKFPMMTGWNFINYDWQYIVNRCKRLQIDISEVSMTKAVDKTDSRPLHIGILDYMQLYDKYDRSVKVKESNSLDYVSSQVLKVNKIKFTGSLQDLYRDNFTKYIYYNVVDSVLVYYIDQKLKSMEVLLTLANITNMPLYKASSPVAVTEAIMARKLAEQGMRIGSEEKKDSNKDGQYAGAFVKEPILGFYEGVSAFDFASLYPSIMRQFNISPDAYIEKIGKSEIAERRKNKEVIVCDNGVVYNTEDSILRKILSDLYQQRKDYKTTSYEYYTKADNLKKLLK
jgi:DNA polymerase elongation subunit (family B)